jgi:hypothetical protein
MLRLLAGAIREPDDGETRDAVLEVRLDFDPASIETDEGMGNGAREHRPTLRGIHARVCAGSGPKSRSAGDEHVFEELARAPAGATIHVAAQALLQAQPRPLQNLWIEVAAVVHDDHHRRPRSQRPPRV